MDKPGKKSATTKLDDDNADVDDSNVGSAHEWNAQRFQIDSSFIVLSRSSQNALATAAQIPFQHWVFIGCVLLFRCALGNVFRFHCWLHFVFGLIDYKWRLRIRVTPLLQKKSTSSFFLTWLTNTACSVTAAAANAHLMLLACLPALGTSTN